MSTREINDQIQLTAYKILDIDCPILYIDDESGYTGYIDFIGEDRFNESVRKGSDKFGRRFITFRANIEYSDGSIIETFTTLFQRYSENEFLWVGAGRQCHLFATEGGTNLSQLQLLFNLLTEKTVIVTEDMINTCRHVPHSYINYPQKHHPIKITLVEKVIKQVEKPVENVEDVMRDLEAKVNPKSVSEGITKLITAIKTNDQAILLNPMEREEILHTWAMQEYLFARIVKEINC